MKNGDRRTGARPLPVTKIVNHTSYHHANMYGSCVSFWCIILETVGGDIGLCASSVMNFYVHYV